MAELTRFEAERARWIASHAGPFAIQRRRGEKLARRVRTAQRSAVGADLDPRAEKLTDPWWWRTTREHGAGVAVGMVLIGLAICAVSALATVVAVVTYRAAWSAVPQRLATVPVGLMTLGGFTATAVGAIGGGLANLDPMAVWACMQPGVGVLVAGGYAVASGWTAVPGAWSLRWPTPKAERGSSWTGTVDADDYALDPMGGYPRVIEPNPGPKGRGREPEFYDLSHLMEDDR